MPTEETRQRVHLRAVQDIARQRFPFPNERYPHLKTFLNVPQPTMGVQVGGALVHPDIVVLQWPQRVVEMVAEVETAHSLSVDKARETWLPSSRAGPLYLFVPVGYADEARRLCQVEGIKYTGLRTWRYVLGYGSIDITDIEAPSFSLRALLSALAARLRRRKGGGRA